MNEKVEKLKEHWKGKQFVVVSIYYDELSQIVSYPAIYNPTIRIEGHHLIIEEINRKAELTDHSIIEISDEVTKLKFKDEDGRDVIVKIGTR